MSEVILRLDTSRDFSECRGERTQDDPHYRVVSWQGTKVKTKSGHKIVQLPFDADGVLVPDDGKTAPYDGTNVEGKVVKHFPLYSDDMRALVKRKLERLKEAAPDEEPEPEDDEGEARETDVNFVSWLKGEVKYDWHILQAAARKRFSIVFQNKKAMVEALVCDENLLPEDQVHPDMAKFLPPKAA